MSTVESPLPPLQESIQNWDWRALLEDLPVGAFLAREGRLLFVNAALQKMFGYTDMDMVATVSAMDLAVPEDRETVQVHVRRRRLMAPQLPYEIECLRQDGSRFDARMAALRILVDGEEADLVTVTDITETRQLIRSTQARLEELRTSVVDLRLGQLMLDQLVVPVITADAQGHIRYANAAACKLMGYNKEQLLSLTIFAVAPHRRTDTWEENLVSLRQVGQRSFESDWCHANGRTLHVDLTASLMTIQGEEHVVICLHDSSRQVTQREQPTQRAHFCEVTGLPNLQMLRGRLRSEALLAIMDRRNIAVLVFSINELQHISEAQSYAVGDQLLQMVTRKLANMPKGSDMLAHLGAGEFVFMVSHEPDITDESAMQVCRSIQEAITTPIQIERQTYALTCHIGMVIFPRDTNEADHVLRQAQAAMRMAMSLGPNRVYSYTPQANAKISARLARETALRGALEREEFHLEYQPQIDLSSGQIIGVEALIRWEHTELGDIAPTDFVPIAEDTGHIIAIGAWVLTTACTAAVNWQKAGLPAVRMAVNLSPKQLHQPDIASVINGILMETGLQPHLLTVELTEHMLHDRQDAVSTALNQLKSIGVSIALDDFGTGYSSLQSLRRLPIDVIKIDRSLVPDVTTETQDVSITRAIINMAHGLQKKVLAVGVESAGELALLCANQCDQMQGFLFSPALTEAGVADILREGKCLPDSILGRKKRTRTLLVVDDDENIVSSLKRLLRKDGYHIVTADCGEQGLQKLAQYEVDVIISDQRMPGMTGVEFLRRTKELYPETIRMVLSGYTELRSVTDAINEGAIYKFLTKPWDDEHVRRHIQEAFHQKEMSDDNKRLDHEVQEANRELAEVNGRLKHLLESQREYIHREETNLIVAREMLENIPAPVIGLDQSGMVAFMNSDAERLFKDSEAMLGRHVEDMKDKSLANVWRLSDGRYHSIDLAGMRFHAVCRPMTSDTRSRGSLMVLVPQGDEP